jgi:hypothetical protein
MIKKSIQFTKGAYKAVTALIYVCVKQYEEDMQARIDLEKALEDNLKHISKAEINAVMITWSKLNCKNICKHYKAQVEKAVARMQGVPDNACAGCHFKSLL